MCKHPIEYPRRIRKDVKISWKWYDDSWNVEKRKEVSKNGKVVEEIHVVVVVLSWLGIPASFFPALPTTRFRDAIPPMVTTATTDNH